MIKIETYNFRDELISTTRITNHVQLDADTTSAADQQWVTIYTPGAVIVGMTYIYGRIEISAE